MTDLQALLAAEMIKLRNSYLERLPLELNEMAELANTLNGKEIDRLILNDLHHRLHKLAGSGGTFGFHTLGEQAKQLELVVKMWLDGVVSADKNAFEQFIEKVSSLSAKPFESDTSEAAKLGVMIPASDIKTRNLLWLVDDDVQLGLELQRLLSQFGYEVRLFTRLGEVETALTSEQPDVLIMDIHFPEEGADSSEEMFIRPGLRALSCPLVFISSHGGFDERRGPPRRQFAAVCLRRMARSTGQADGVSLRAPRRTADQFRRTLADRSLALDSPRWPALRPRGGRR